MDYYEKYIKYKTKYLKLISKNFVQVGGDVTLILHPDRINFFIDEHMAQYLNPIYGLIMYKSGFIANTLHLHNSEFIKTRESAVIKKGCKISGGRYVTTGLKTVNLSPLSQLETIGNYFLSDCSGLTSIDL